MPLSTGMLSYAAIGIWDTYFDFACPEAIFVAVRLWTHLSHLSTRLHTFALTPSHDLWGLT